MENEKRIFKLFIILFITLAIFYILSFGMIQNMMLLLIIMGLLAFLSALIIVRMDRGAGVKKFNQCLNTDEKNDISEGLKDDSTIQVKICTQVTEICEKLNTISRENSKALETIAAYMDISNANIIEQYNMLKNTNDLVSKIESNNEKLINILGSSNEYRKILEDMKYVIRENAHLVKEMTLNINNITSFSENISKRIMNITNQIMEQNNKAKYLQEMIEKLNVSVYNA